jgi:hypothetical protein
MDFGFFVGHCNCDWRFTTLLKLIRDADLKEVESIRTHHLKHKRNPKFDQVERALKERLG